MIISSWLLEVYFSKYVTGKKRTGPPQKYLQKTCGDLCHLEGKLTSWNFLDYATSEVILNESNRTYCNTWCLQVNCTSLFLLSQDIESNGEQYEDNPTWAQLSRLSRRHFLKERRLTGDILQTLATLKLIFYCRFKYQDLYFSRQHQELKKINYVFNEDIFNHFKGEPL